MAVGDKKPVVMEFDRAVPGGAATLNDKGKVPKDQLPDYSIEQVTGLNEMLEKKQDTLTFDAEPQKGSSNPVKSGGVFGVLSAKQNTLVGNPGQLIGIGESGAEATVYPSNPNLLDNWHFIGGGSQQGGGKFPINQRGQIEYGGSTGQYSIDRWYINNETGTLTVNHGFVSLSGEKSTSHALAQIIENTDDLLGKTVTYSALSKDNELVYKTYKIPEERPKAALSLGSAYFQDGNYINLYFYSGKNCLLGANFVVSAGNDSCDIVAIKLELGSVQTLAHKEGDTWVLNDPPPNYALELAKCQRHMVQNNVNGSVIGWGYAYTNTNIAGATFHLPPMRVNPTIFFQSLYAVSSNHTGGNGVLITSAIQSPINGGDGGYACAFQCSGGGLTPGEFLMLQIRGTGCFFRADSNL